RRLEKLLQTCPDTIFIAHGPAWWSEISSDVNDETRGGYPKEPITAPGRVSELLTTYSNLHGDTLESLALRIKEKCDHLGVEVANYAISADFINGSGSNAEAEVERVKDEVRVARILGSSAMRHDATSGFKPEHKGARGFDDALPALAKGCRAVTEFASDLGVKTMVENHGYFCQDSDRVEKLVNAVNHPNFGALIDIGNFACVDENPGTAVGRLMPYASHVHVKDFHFKRGTDPWPGKGWFLSRGGNYLRCAIIGHGNVPVTQCLKIVKNAGYDGVLAIEFEGIEDVLTGISMGYENLRRFVSEL
ncbi:sugar phosphate isomerase/epimerase family protein, partial [Verrucomicrobiota bacterium]